MSWPASDSETDIWLSTHDVRRMVGVDQMQARMVALGLAPPGPYDPTEATTGRKPNAVVNQDGEVFPDVPAACAAVGRSHQNMYKRLATTKNEIGVSGWWYVRLAPAWVHDKIEERNAAKETQIYRTGETVAAGPEPV